MEKITQKGEILAYLDSCKPAEYRLRARLRHATPVCFGSVYR